MERTDPRKLLIDVTDILDRLHIPYLITGGMAVFIWGRPRFTADIDIVVEMAPTHVEQLEKSLQALGEQGYVDQETMKDAFDRRGEFNFVDGVTGVKVDFWVSTGDPFDVSRLARRVGKKILGKIIYFSSPEDLILSKLRWFNEGRSLRQFEDIRSVIALSGSLLDRAYLETWAEKLGVIGELQAAFETIS